MAAERTLSRPRRARARPGIRQVPGDAGLGRAALHGLPLVGGTGVVRRRPLPPVERHPQQPHPAMGGGDRARSASSASRRTTPTATRATARAGWSPASTTRGASRAPSPTARSPCWPIRYKGKQLNSPNDVVVKSDGSIWFTDPPFGILGYYEGHKAEPENCRPRLPRRPQDREARGGGRRRRRPNGLAFSPDETKLYVVDSRASRTARSSPTT